MTSDLSFTGGVKVLEEGQEVTKQTDRKYYRLYLYNCNTTTTTTTVLQSAVITEGQTNDPHHLLQLLEGAGETADSLLL